jgi:hypothetical protein
MNRTNLDYDAQSSEIHRNYNNWVAGLQRSIEKQMRWQPR